MLEYHAFLYGFQSCEGYNCINSLKSDGFWIYDFQLFTERSLYDKYISTNKWSTNLGTSYHLWIYENQKSNEEGIKIFYYYLDKFQKFRDDVKP
jgi:hypothetical protein